MTEKFLQKNIYSSTASVSDKTIRFVFVSKETDCGVILYDRETGAELKRIPFKREECMGHVYCKMLTDVNVGAVKYLFYENDRLVTDRRAQVYYDVPEYGTVPQANAYKAGFLTGEYDWEGDCRPMIPFHENIGYCLHVRGFTMHDSSGVQSKGTFQGILEKLSYLKEIGVNLIELQPAYEFAECGTAAELQCITKDCYGRKYSDGNECRLNYWGYQKGYYYAPKKAYCASENTVEEFKLLVKELHKNKMELIMQFYFTSDMTTEEILDILRFWVSEYHVDGFHLMGDGIQENILAKDPWLADTKLMYYHFDENAVYGRNDEPTAPHLAEYNDTWYYEMRKFLKGDDNMLKSVLYHMRYIPQRSGRIHYLTNYHGLTLADMVSYDYKHNEANGEGNRDGNDYNCSFNCGVEGATANPDILRLRMKQMKNALCLILLSQSTPLIFMGDEFGNSQGGNNNPYCQDNDITRLDWRVAEKNRELTDFWKLLLNFRRTHNILCPKMELRLMDYLSLGYPDLSYHGEKAWMPQLEYCRHVGMMYCGKYERKNNSTEDCNIYIAMNMHWEEHRLALPKAPENRVWKMVAATDDSVRALAPEEFMADIPPKSIVIYVTE